jgi:hypothetical protein
VPKAAVKQAEDLTGAWAQEHLERIAARVQERGIALVHFRCQNQLVVKAFAQVLCSN